MLFVSLQLTGLLRSPNLTNECSTFQACQRAALVMSDTLLLGHELLIQAQSAERVKVKVTSFCVDHSSTSVAIHGIFVDYV